MKKLVQKIKDTLDIFSSSKGFTLLELLVVVLIIGILAGIALPQYKKVLLKTHFTKMEKALKDLINAQQRYFIANGTNAVNRNYLDIDYPRSETAYPNDKYLIKVSDDMHCSIAGQNNNVYCATSSIMLQYSFLTSKFYCCNYKLSDYEIDNLCKQFTQASSENGSNSYQRCYYGRGHQI